MAISWAKEIADERRWTIRIQRHGWEGLTVIRLPR